MQASLRNNPGLGYYQHYYQQHQHQQQQQQQLHQPQQQIHDNINQPHEQLNQQQQQHYASGVYCQQAVLAVADYEDERQAHECQQAASDGLLAHHQNHHNHNHNHQHHTHHHNLHEQQQQNESRAAATATRLLSTDENLYYPEELATHTHQAHYLSHGHGQQHHQNHDHHTHHFQAHQAAPLNAAEQQQLYPHGCHIIGALEPGLQLAQTECSVAAAATATDDDDGEEKVRAQMSAHFSGCANGGGVSLYGATIATSARQTVPGEQYNEPGAATATGTATATATATATVTSTGTASAAPATFYELPQAVAYMHQDGAGDYAQQPAVYHSLSSTAANSGDQQAAAAGLEENLETPLTNYQVDSSSTHRLVGAFAAQEPQGASTAPQAFHILEPRDLNNQPANVVGTIYAPYGGGGGCDETNAAAYEHHQQLLLCEHSHTATHLFQPTNSATATAAAAFVLAATSGAPAATPNANSNLANSCSAPPSTSNTSCPSRSSSTCSSEGSDLAESLDSTLTRDERKAREANIPLSYYEIVNLSIDQFNEHVSKFNFTEAQLTLMKDIRRRGKNKVAAQTCRKRKMEQISELQHEVNLLNERKMALSYERGQLEAERERLLRTYERMYSAIRHCVDRNEEERQRRHQPHSHTSRCQPLTQLESGSKSHDGQTNTTVAASATTTIAEQQHSLASLQPLDSIELCDSRLLAM